LSENSSTSRHRLWAFAGFGPFGLGPALGAHYPLALALVTPDLQHVVRQQISYYSSATFTSPRKRNPRMPRPPFIWPNTGSMILFRAA
jgi:hypothetical protein